MKTVIIEDDFLIVAQIQECLVRLGHDVLATFDTASEALNFLKEHPVDFVFMDIELNGPIDGIQCANTLQKNYNTPSIFVTSHHQNDVIQESMNAAPLNFLPKPFEDSNIEAAVALAEIHLKKEAPQSSNEVIEIGAYELSLTYKVLSHKGAPVKLTEKERSLVTLLFQNRGNIVSLQKIDQVVFENRLTSSDALRRLVSRTREKLTGLQIKAEPKEGYYIKENLDF